MDSTIQTCLCRGCSEPASYNFPFCKSHWRLWEKGELEECDSCHWFVEEFGGDDEDYDGIVTNKIINAFSSEPPDLAPLEWENAFDGFERKLWRVRGFVCYRCTFHLFMNSPDRPKGAIPRHITELAAEIGAKTSPPAHRPIMLQVRYVYVLSLTGGAYYVGYTSDLRNRLREHQSESGGAATTRGKDPRLVYFETYEGRLDYVKEREQELTRLNLTPAGRRQLADMVEDFQEPLRLLDLTPSTNQ